MDTRFFFGAFGLLVAVAAVAVGLVVVLIVLLRRQPTARPAERFTGDRDFAASSHGSVWTPNAVGGHCPSCGGELPSDSPLGLCPQCLFQGAMSRARSTPPPQDEAAVPVRPGAAPAVADLVPLFPQLEILGLIGQGGMGAVYQARQIKLDRLVAVKVLPTEWGKDPAFAERFAREARALARLSHRHVVGVHDFGETGGLFYLVMEFVDGINLRQVLQDGPLPPEQALHLIPQICDALQYAHEEGVVHRDIKPENILLDRRGNVKIADFGLAKLVRRSAADLSLTGTHQVMGTLDYMAPEQRSAPQDVDHRADIYALGVVFYEMLTGELPLGRFAAPSAKAAVDPRVDDIVFRALEREPGQRYQHISEVKIDVASIAQEPPTGMPVAGPAKTPWADLQPELVQMRVKAPAAALLLTGVVVLIEGMAAFAGLLMLKENSPNVPPTAMDALLVVYVVGALALIATMIGGAVKMAKLESYGWVITAIILAMLPFSYHWLIGLPVGIWAAVIMSRPEVKAAFALNLRKSSQAWQNAGASRFQPHKPTGPIMRMLHSALTFIVHRPRPAGSGSAPVSRPSAPPRRIGFPGWVVAVVLGVAVFVGCGVGLLVIVEGVFWGRGEVTGHMGMGSNTTNPPLAFYRGDMRSIGINSGQWDQINDILRAADREYLKLEGQNTEHVIENDKHIITVAAFPEELKNLEERVWKQIEAVVGKYDQFTLERCRQLLPLRGGLFPLGKERTIIEIKHQFNKGEFWWRVPSAPGAQTRWFHGPQLPQEYARFWDEGK
jgi:hypothetical protein